MTLLSSSLIVSLTSLTFPTCSYLDRVSTVAILPLSFDYWIYNVVATLLATTYCPNDVESIRLYVSEKLHALYDAVEILYTVSHVLQFLLSGVVYGVS